MQKFILKYNHKELSYDLFLINTKKNIEAKAVVKWFTHPVGAIPNIHQMWLGEQPCMDTAELQKRFRECACRIHVI
jgi:hypothetical protein